jgi:hypothetical protein
VRLLHGGLECIWFSFTRFNFRSDTTERILTRDCEPLLSISDRVLEQPPESSDIVSIDGGGGEGIIFQTSDIRRIWSGEMGLHDEPVCQLYLQLQSLIRQACREKVDQKPKGE